MTFNSLTPGRSKWNLRYIIFKLILWNAGWGTPCEIAFRWMSLDLSEDKSTLVQVMAWCHQVTSHYLSQCWPRFMLPYGVTRPQWVYTRTQGISSHCIDLDPDSVSRCHLTIVIGNPIVEIKQSYECLISTKEFFKPVRWHLSKSAVTPVH